MYFGLIVTMHGERNKTLGG